MDRSLQDYRRDGYISGVEIGVTDMRAPIAHDWKVLKHKKDRFTINRKPIRFEIAAEIATGPQNAGYRRVYGPDILLYNVTYIIKEPQSMSHVSWHQDLTYWGLSHDDQVSAWVALSDADELSGCMQMILGSHHQGNGASTQPTMRQTCCCRAQLQAISMKLPPMPVKTGQASFHHGWTLHASMPNKSEDRRIGLNIQYVACHVRQTKHDHDTAMLVRGVDTFNHFGKDLPAAIDLEPAALIRQKNWKPCIRKSQVMPDACRTERDVGAVRSAIIPLRS